MLSHTDTQGHQVQYAYDAQGRVSTLTPPQGTDYRTEYGYNTNGSLSWVRTYDGGTASQTDYTYSTTSGKLTARDFPTVSAQHTRTAYSYDSAGRLEYETLSLETSGGSTNISRTGYVYSYLTYGNQVVRTEQRWVLGAASKQERRRGRSRHLWIQACAGTVAGTTQTGGQACR